MIKTNKQNLAIVIILFIGICYGSVSWFMMDEPDYPEIIIRGEKPEGSQVVLWASYYIGGEQCDQYTFSALDMKAHRGGVQNIKYTESLSDSSTEYQYKLRYQKHTDDQCQVTLKSITLNAYSKLDNKSGFAELNLSNIKNKSINNNGLNIPLAEAKNCNTNIVQLPNEYWLGGVLCDMYINDRLKEKKTASNYRARLDFSKLKPNQEIVYNIIPGPDYKDGHFNEKTGKIED